jgi:gas vesicle protein
MNNFQGPSFIQGLLLGGLVGASVAVLIAPAAGAITRKQIRDESIELTKRGQAFGNSARRQAQNMIKQDQPRVSNTRS